MQHGPQDDLVRMVRTPPSSKGDCDFSLLSSTYANKEQAVPYLHWLINSGSKMQLSSTVAWALHSRDRIMT